MCQVNGPGAGVALIAVLLAACAAECIPLALCLLAVAAGGIGYDYARGHVSDRAKPPGEHHLASDGGGIGAHRGQREGVLGEGAAALVEMDSPETDKQEGII